MTPIVSVASARQVRALDVAVVVWVVFWLGMGAFVGWNLHQLRELGTTVDTAADALDQTGQALDAIASVPLIGSRVGPLAHDVQDTAAQAHQSAADSQSAVTRLSWLLGIVIVVIPDVPAVWAYVPWRRRWRRDRDAIVRAQGEHDPLVSRYLATRAVANLPLDVLQSISADPWSDLDRGDFERLAAAECVRLGLTAPEDMPRREQGVDERPSL